MATGCYRTPLATANYRSLLLAQFSGALNDNLYRMVASLFSINLVGGGSAYVALAGVLFIVPFLTLSGLAGRLVDTWGARAILIAAKSAEVVVMGLAIVAFYVGSIDFVLVVLFLMAAQSTFFSPARYGILPNIVAKHDLSRANGLGEAAMFSAILLGAGLGGAVFELSRDRLHLAAMPMMAIAFVGLLAACRVASARTTAPSAHLATGGIGQGLRLFRRNPVLGMAVFVVSAFWGLGATAQFDILFYGRNVLEFGESAIGLLQATLGLGIGIGCLVAGWLSGDRVHLGLAQIGIAGAGSAFVMLGLLPALSPVAFVLIGTAGFSGGLLVVPMISLMHQHSQPAKRGLLFATNNVLNMFGVLVGVGLAYGLHDMAGIGPAAIFVVVGFLALALAAANLPARCALLTGPRSVASGADPYPELHST